MYFLQAGVIIWRGYHEREEKSNNSLNQQYFSYVILKSKLNKFNEKTINIKPENLSNS